MTGKTQNLGRISAQSSSHNENFVNASKKNTEKFSLPCCELFHMKSKVCFKYFAHDCL